ncbi:PRKCA-binding protein-like isoform X3 [Neocloeon triangulifer]|uniref:PRKCA-binding protein-like isoform X3 n=2 Tax=Neocloeon triangulifer TaxID=2078957 RepID=UPI00286F5A5F|nr:PRKCA-binding protein-like isoform X3 [Neocloeon triangulifer]
MLDYEDEYFLEEDKMFKAMSSNPRYYYQPEWVEDRMGMTVSAASVTLSKDANNLIGISIGGGAPLCPCLYVVQVFDNTPAAKEGSLQSGDELLAVEGQSVKGKTKGEAAKMIQAAEGKVTIHFNRLHADPKQGKGLDLAMKKAKHRLVENMSTATADALGLSRAILCNDSLVKKLQELEGTEGTYRGLVEHSQRVLRANFELLQVYKAFGDTFAAIGVREPQPRASEAFRTFGDQHRQIEKEGIKMLQTVKPILSDLGTYLFKAIPDTKLTIKKYADAKFEYLSYCLKVKEMDDEEHSYASLQEPLYRLETGNYEYRLVLRCRQEARTKFAKLRADVLVKLELLDNKHVQDVTLQLKRLLTGLAAFHKASYDLLNEGQLFPVEVDLSRSAFSYPSSDQIQADEDDDTEILPDTECERTEPELKDDDSHLIDIDLFSGMSLSSSDPPKEQAPSDLDDLFGADDSKTNENVGDLLGL